MTEQTISQTMITDAKLEHWQDQADSNAVLLEISLKAQSFKDKIEAATQKAQQRLNLELAPANASLELLNRDIQRITLEFQQRDAERNAYIKALEKTTGVASGRNETA